MKNRSSSPTASPLRFMNVSGLASSAPAGRHFAISASAGAALPVEPVPRDQLVDDLEADVVARARVLPARVAEPDDELHPGRYAFF